MPRRRSGNPGGGLAPRSGAPGSAIRLVVRPSLEVGGGVACETLEVGVGALGALAHTL